MPLATLMINFLSIAYTPLSGELKSAAVYIMKINCISDFQLIHPHSIYVQSKCNQCKTHFMSFLFPSSSFVHRYGNGLKIGHFGTYIAWTHTGNASTRNGCRIDASGKPERQQHGSPNADVHIWNCCIFRIHHNEGNSNKWIDWFTSHKLYFPESILLRFAVGDEKVGGYNSISATKEWWKFQRGSFSTRQQ